MLLILVLIWGVVSYSWFRARLRTNFADPVSTFRRNLDVLDQARSEPGPQAGRVTTLSPAVVSTARASLAEAGRAPVVIGSRPDRRSGRTPISAARRARRHETLRRRRDVLLALVTGALGSLLLGAIPGLHSMLVVQVIFDLLVFAYVARLIRLHRLAVERHRKIAYLPRASVVGVPRATSSGVATIRATPLEAWVAPASALR